jgi:hypothetical protein
MIRKILIICLTSFALIFVYYSILTIRNHGIETKLASKRHFFALAIKEYFRKNGETPSNLQALFEQMPQYAYLTNCMYGEKIYWNYYVNDFRGLLVIQWNRKAFIVTSSFDEIEIVSDR